MHEREKNFLITTEKHEVVIIRGGVDKSRDQCPKCGVEVEFVSFDTAIELSGLSGRDLVRRIAAESIHSIDTDRGTFRVCRNSLEREK